MPSADCPDALGLPCGWLTPPMRGASGLSRGYPCCFRYVAVESTKCAWQPEDFGLCCTLVPRIAPLIRFPVRSARIFASGFLSAPLTGIQLPSATLRRYPTGTGLARLISTSPRYRLDLFPRSGTLARAHPQATGLARHTTTPCSVRLASSPPETVTVRQRHFDKTDEMAYGITYERNWV